MGQREGWYPAPCQPPDWIGEVEPLAPRQIAAIYRGLRKGREDSKDAPGAADFYYGEMEMRRLDRESPRAERLILWLYWLTSGYGLRASRALAALAVTVAVFAAPLLKWGFAVDKSFVGALTFSAQSALGLLRPPEQRLTGIGVWLQITLRLAGPLLLGLALLSLRGRVKR